MSEPEVGTPSGSARGMILPERHPACRRHEARLGLRCLHSIPHRLYSAMCRSVGREAMIREVRREISTKCLQRAAEAEAQANRQEDALTLKLARRGWVASIGLLHGRCLGYRRVRWVLLNGVQSGALQPLAIGVS